MNRSRRQVRQLFRSLKLTSVNRKIPATDIYSIPFVACAVFTVLLLVQYFTFKLYLQHPHSMWASLISKLVRIGIYG